MPIFTKDENSLWVSAPQASGPFHGLQGGAIAALMVSELEQLAQDQELGLATSASVEFIRPTPSGPLRTQPECLRRGRRVSVFTNALYDGDTLTAKATTCFINPRAVPEISDPKKTLHDPTALPVLPARSAPHGRPWMMDLFEVRKSGDGIVWFRYTDDIVAPMSVMGRFLGPADWTHGLGRPAEPKLADPNINLQVTLARQPSDEFIGIRPRTTWMRSGIGLGEGELFDVEGFVGRVAMSVALTPFE